jgi:hypothetical protein
MAKLLVVLTVGVVACGSGGISGRNGGGGGGEGNSGTTEGTYTMSLTGASAGTTETGTITLTVK